MEQHKGEYLEIRCNNKGRRKAGLPCNSYLGEIQVDVPNSSKFHCPHCHITYQYIVDKDLVVTKSISKARTTYVSVAAVVEEGYDADRK